MSGHVAVVVLGDVGRSPRMCNHASSLSTSHHVHLVGYFDSIPHQKLVENERIHFVPLAPPPDALSNLPDVIQLPLKLVWAFFTLLVALVFRTRFMGLELILMQNPPALPTMMACYFAALINKARFVIDWHNYMFSILRDKYNIPQEELLIKSTTKHRIVRTVAALEMRCGKWADGGLCVTEAMKEELQSVHGIRAEVFYDRPPGWAFGHATVENVHDLCHKLNVPELSSENGNGTDTRLTTNTMNGVTKAPTRPLVLISCTSWTPDEHFDILLEASSKYNEAKMEGNENLPELLIIITGKGPLKEHYLSEIERMQMKHVQYLTPWLEAGDYPVMIAAADLGVSLHISTSGVDLPMKVVDMFGARKPVLAKKFRCIGELVKEGENGHLFDNSEDLYQLLLQLAPGFPNSEKIQKLEGYFEKNEFVSWETMWTRCAKPVLLPQIS